MSVRPIRSANAEFQVLDALRTNRQKRNRENAFIVEGVRNIDAALAHGWTIRSALHVAGARRSAWAESVIARVDDLVELAPELFSSLTDRDEPPELLLVTEKRTVTLAELTLGENAVVTVLDRPASPGNIGTILRTTDALGGRGVVIVGHGADPYDPRSVRASTGSLFAVPVMDVGGADELVAWANSARVTLVGTDEAADTALDALPPGPVALLFGNETTGLSTSLRAAATATIGIAMANTGTASSLNVAAAHAIVLHAATAALRA